MNNNYVVVFCKSGYPIPAFLQSRQVKTGIPTRFLREAGMKTVVQRVFTAQSIPTFLQNGYYTKQVWVPAFLPSRL